MVLKYATNHRFWSFMQDPSDEIMRNLLRVQRNDDAADDGEEVSVNELFDMFERGDIGEPELMKKFEDMKKQRVSLMESLFRTLVRN